LSLEHEAKSPLGGGVGDASGLALDRHVLSKISLGARKVLTIVVEGGSRAVERGEIVWHLLLGFGERSVQVVPPLLRHQRAHQPTVAGSPIRFDPDGFAGVHFDGRGVPRVLIGVDVHQRRVALVFARIRLDTLLVEIVQSVALLRLLREARLCQVPLGAIDSTDGLCRGVCLVLVAAHDARGLEVKDQHSETGLDVIWLQAQHGFGRGLELSRESDLLQHAGAFGLLAVHQGERPLVPRIRRRRPDGSLGVRQGRCRVPPLKINPGHQVVRFGIGRSYLQLRLGYGSHLFPVSVPHHRREGLVAARGQRGSGEGNKKPDAEKNVHKTWTRGRCRKLLPPTLYRWGPDRHRTGDPANALAPRSNCWPLCLSH